MRVMVFAMVAALTAGMAWAQWPVQIAPDPDEHASPFPAQRGTAPKPPAESASTQTPPPEGAASGGIDFGQWRAAADAGTYGATFQSQIRQRYAGKNAA